MIRLSPGLAAAFSIIVSMLPSRIAIAQGYNEHLTIQGLDRQTMLSASSRAAGGTTIGSRNDIGLMFANPASLQSLQGVQVSVGGVQHYTRATQVQQYAPLKYYSNFSLLMEGLTGSIPDPRYNDSTGIVGTNVGDTLQRPYDSIGPNWSRSKDRGLPLQVLLAFPFSFGEKKFAAGIGAIQFANVDHFYQNNNVLSPSILSERPIPIPRPPSDSLPVQTQWSQFQRSRQGSIHGYGAALSGSFSDEIVIGVSALILKGSSDDNEQEIGRGRLTFYPNYFRLDSVHRLFTRTGTSDYTGYEMTISGMYRGRSVIAGFSVKPPTTITRSYTTNVRIDTTGTPFSSTMTGEDKVRLPWRGTVGLSIVPVSYVTLGLEYEIRSYASAVYTQPDGTEAHPWISASVLHVGAELHALPWLVLRAGIRDQAEAFEPEGNPIAGEPVHYSVYSAGAGVSFGAIRMSVAYEYAEMKYQDVWGSAISINTERRHTIIADLVYEIPWLQ